MRSLISLNRNQAAYIVAALHYTITTKDNLEEKDRMHMESIMTEIAAPLNLTNDVRQHLDQTHKNN